MSINKRTGPLGGARACLSSLTREVIKPAPLPIAQAGVILVLLVVMLGSMSTRAYGYGYYRWGNGRSDYSNRYDLAGSMWPAQANEIYNFGTIGALTAGDLTTLGITAMEMNTAVQNAGNAWEQHINVSIGDTTGANNTGMIRLRYDNTLASGAYNWGYNHPRGAGGTGAQPWSEINFGTQAAPGVPWNATNFQWTLMHELGHTLGLRDMYQDFAGAPYAEDFVDHPVAGNANPQRDDTSQFPQGDGRRDNVMDRYRYTSNDYSQGPQTVIDNDEIAGAAWLWGASHHQVVTGDLANQWSGDVNNSVRVTDPHHGDQADNILGWWDYRGSVASPGEFDDRPYIDLQFAGFEQFLSDTYPVVTIEHVNLGGDMHRFYFGSEEDIGSWSGNFNLYLKSTFTEERRINALMYNGRQTDIFDLAPSTNGLTFDGTNRWAQVFGPVPEPSTIVLAALGMIGLVLVARKRTVL